MDLVEKTEEGEGVEGELIEALKIAKRQQGGGGGGGGMGALGGGGEGEGVAVGDNALRALKEIVEYDFKNILFCFVVNLFSSSPFLSSLPLPPFLKQNRKKLCA